MIYGIGVDIAELDRVAAIQMRLDFAKKVLSSQELTVWEGLSGKRAKEFLAGRFSAKEAYSKAFGTGIGKQVGFQDITILDEANGRPVITAHPFNGRAHVSISHTDNYIMTEVILEEE